jgi:hypothetical protein
MGKVAIGRVVLTNREHRGGRLTSRDIRSRVFRLAGPPCDWLILQQRIFHRLPLPVLLKQIIEGLDGQGV